MFSLWLVDYRRFIVRTSEEKNLANKFHLDVKCVALGKVPSILLAFKKLS